jgi:hypothetical protein
MSTQAPSQLGPHGENPGVIAGIKQTIYTGYMASVITASLAALAKTLYNAFQISTTSRLNYGAMFGDPASCLFWVCVAGCIAIALSIVMVLAVGTHFARRIWQQRGKAGSLADLCYIAVVETYDAKRFWDLDCLQAGLRATLVIFVLTAALASLFERHIQGTIHALPLIEACNAAQVVLSCLYVTVMAVEYGSNRRQLIALHVENSKNPVERFDDKVSLIFWQSAKWDLFYVTVIFVSTLFLHRPLYLGYILPLMGTWLFLQHHARKAFYLVIAGLFGHFCVLAGFSLCYPDLASELGYGQHRALILFWETFPSLSFWLALALILATLRRLRWKAKENTKDLEENLRIEAERRQGLEILGTGEGHAIFVKNLKRRIIFGNEIFFEMLTPIARKKGWMLRDGRARWEDIYLKTDEELGIDCPAYTQSDTQILNSPGGATDRFEGFEPAFHPNAVQGAMLWTRKKAIRKDGKVVGLVGCTAPGLPVQISQMSEFLTMQLPLYATMKDTHGNIVWANPRHLEMLEPRINELLAEAGLPPDEYLELQKLASVEAKLKALNGGRGPDDSQLYGADGTAYSDKDAVIIRHAIQHIQRGGSPKDFGPEMDALLKAWFPTAKIDYPKQGWPEYHRFPGHNEGIWMEVWKCPWWEERMEDGKKVWDVKGVLVFFRDLAGHSLPVSPESYPEEASDPFPGRMEFGG